MNNDITTYIQDPSVSYKNEESNQILSVIKDYNIALTLLDDYDHQCMQRPDGRKAIYVITYDECRNIIDIMNFKNESVLFGNEKDDSFKGSIGNIYQTYNGEDVYPTLEEKAANLLYIITKNYYWCDKIALVLNITK